MSACRRSRHTGGYAGGIQGHAGACSQMARGNSNARAARAAAAQTNSFPAPGWAGWQGLVLPGTA